MQKNLRIAAIVLTCLAVGYFSSLITRENIPTWYVTLKKPIFNPPNWVFAPVWTILYIMMGIAAGRVWNKVDNDLQNVKKGMYFFIVQLALNALWSYLFFGIHNLFLSLIEIILLWLMIYETMVQFKKVDKLASKLLIPYLVWVSYATILTASVWYLNK
ncbi:TspO/MBR family protein [Flavobacterium sp.]|uniref:TspO/MBR family protein n=1 Tax=Flavobacterium sp. TaxID=239 RepID=UPI0035AE778D